MSSNFEAQLQLQPLHIVRMFFSRSDIAFRQNKNIETLNNVDGVSSVNYYPEKFSFGSGVTFYEERNQQCVEVIVGIKSEDDKCCNFFVECVGKYIWDSEDFTEKIKKNIFAWAASLQISAIREHIARETASGPFGIPYYLPVALVGVTEKDAADKVASNGK